jgi:Ni/Co efflux regulator RcnB
MRLASLAIVALLSAAIATPAFAQKDKDDKPGRGGPPDRGASASPGKGQGQGHGQGPAQAASPQVNVVINDRDRNAVYGYYRAQYAAGHCPPGLAKKNNGCLPPGQAKKLWAIGQPLPSGVTYYPLPGALLAQLSPAPAGYEYVRVANDILMMAVGTRLIAAAIADLSSF